MLIGLVGRNGSGKSSACHYLSSKGFVVYSLSDVLRALAAQNGLQADRDTLVDLGSRLKAKEGTDVLARRCWDASQRVPHQDIIFDSIRNADEALFLKSKGVELVAIETPIAIRYKRIFSRNGQTDHVDFETFCLQDEREESGQSSGQNISAAMTYCDKIIINDQTPQHLFKQLESLCQN